MTATQVQALINNNLIGQEDTTQEYVEVQIPNWMIEILLLLFPNWSPEKSIEHICQQFLEEAKHIKAN